MTLPFKSVTIGILTLLILTAPMASRGEYGPQVFSYATGRRDFGPNGGRVEGYEGRAETLRHRRRSSRCGFPGFSLARLTARLREHTVGCRRQHLRCAVRFRAFVRRDDREALRSSHTRSFCRSAPAALHRHSTSGFGSAGAASGHVKNDRGETGAEVFSPSASSRNSLKKWW